MKNIYQVASAASPASLSHAKHGYPVPGWQLPKIHRESQGVHSLPLGELHTSHPTQLSEATPLLFISTTGLYRAWAVRCRREKEGGTGNQAEEHHKDISPLLFQPF